MGLDPVMVTMQLAAMGYANKPFKIGTNEKTGRLEYYPYAADRGYLESGITGATRWWKGESRQQLDIINPCIQTYAKVYDLSKAHSKAGDGSPADESVYGRIAIAVQHSLELMQAAYTEGMAEESRRRSHEFQILGRSIIDIRDAINGDFAVDSDTKRKQDPAPKEQLQKWNDYEHRIGAETLAFARYQIQSEKVDAFVYNAMEALNNLMGDRPGLQEKLDVLESEEAKEKERLLALESAQKAASLIAAPPPAEQGTPPSSSGNQSPPPLPEKEKEKGKGSSAPDETLAIAAQPEPTNAWGTGPGGGKGSRGGHKRS
jgi:hypothetical protein